MRKTAVYIIVSLMILSSCSHKNEAIELSRDFFTSLSDSTYGKPVDFYPDYDSLGIEAKSDVVDIDEKSSSTTTTPTAKEHSNRTVLPCSLREMKISSSTFTIPKDLS